MLDRAGSCRASLVFLLRSGLSRYDTDAKDVWMQTVLEGRQGSDASSFLINNQSRVDVHK